MSNCRSNRWSVGTACGPGFLSRPSLVYVLENARSFLGLGSRPERSEMARAMHGTFQIRGVRSTRNQSSSFFFFQWVFPFSLQVCGGVCCGSSTLRKRVLHRASVGRNGGGSLSRVGSHWNLGRRRVAIDVSHLFVLVRQQPFRWWLRGSCAI